jgi:hypothetical protein
VADSVEQSSEYCASVKCREFIENIGGKFSSAVEVMLRLFLLLSIITVVIMQTITIIEFSFIDALTVKWPIIKKCPKN